MEPKEKCFVVMPFGKKPFKDGTNRTYDFDKVYRVIIKRAIKQAGLVPVRADETEGNRLIHTDMFKDLRDQKIVLVDLSLDNPNVYYELGVRHVMSSTGTVLICRKGTILPFDIQLSRVIFYEFDGVSFDWEEAETVVKQIEQAITEALKGEFDSPIHSLLENVTKQTNNNNNDNRLLVNNTEDYTKYEQLVADYWQKSNQKLDDIFESEHDNIFGIRALAHLALMQSEFSATANKVAYNLYIMMQYKLANKIYKKYYDANQLGYWDLLKYASSYTEEYDDLEGAFYGLNLIDQGLNIVNIKYTGIDTEKNYEALKSYAQVYDARAHMFQWKWELTDKQEDLEQTIQAFYISISYFEKANKINNGTFTSNIAQIHLKLLILLRIYDNDKNRVDSENHGKAILELKPLKSDTLQGNSYLNWYQAIILADLNADKAARKKAESNYADDKLLLDKYKDIGRSQYMFLKRFIVSFSKWFRHEELIGAISKILSQQHI